MRKGLNNKGFTLVELLAVVVILALVMGIAASSMLSTMNSSRKSTLHSAAQTAAANLNSWVADDLLIANDDERKLGNTFVQNTQGTQVTDAEGNPISGKDAWICLNDTKLTITNGSATDSLVIVALGLNADDFVMSGSVPVFPYTKEEDGKTVSNITASTCSAVRYNSNTGGYEFFLNANSKGKYYVAGDGETNNYAFSRATASAKPITD